MKEILFISPYPELAAVGKKIAGENDDIEFNVTRMDEAVKVALKAEKKGCQVIVSRGITAWKIKHSGIELPLIDIQIGGCGGPQKLDNVLSSIIQPERSQT